MPGPQGWSSQRQTGCKAWRLDSGCSRSHPQSLARVSPRLSCCSRLKHSVSLNLFPFLNKGIKGPTSSFREDCGREPGTERLHAWLSLRQSLRHLQHYYSGLPGVPATGKPGLFLELKIQLATLRQSNIKMPTASEESIWISSYPTRFRTGTREKRG